MARLTAVLFFVVALQGQMLQSIVNTNPVVAASGISSAPVQQVNASRNTLIVAFGSNTAAGCLITVTISNDGGGQTVTTVADTQLNTYVKATATLGGNGQGAEIWYAKNCAGGADTVTVTVATPCFVSIQEWSGASTSAPLDAVVTGTGASVGPLTTALASEMLIVINVNSASNAVCTGYTQLGAGVGNWTYQSMYKQAGAAGSQTASGCVNSGFTVLVMAAFK